MLKPVLQPRKPIDRQYLSISELNRKVKGLLESNVGQVLIEGEISNFIAAASGHWYFTLKDANAQVKCTMWRGRNSHLKFRPENGMQIYARSTVTLYEARGDYQLAVDFMEPAGLGNLQIQFEQLKEKLGAEGLFKVENKNPIPKRPQKVGVITSPTGAAIRDVLSVMKRRFPMTQIIIYPCQVQGKQAHHSIIQAINAANQRNEVDVLLITRGGGSLEDLWCFNEEELAYAIAQSRLPTVSAVGHEIDFTISDFVADYRAATPSAAAELLTADSDQMKQSIDDFAFRLFQSIEVTLNDLENQLSYLSLSLSDPDPVLDAHKATLDNLYSRLQRTLTGQLTEQRTKLHDAHLRLIQHHPEKALSSVDSKNNALAKQLRFALKTLINSKQQKLSAASGRLNSVSPLSTLARGYSITLKDNELIHNATQLQTGDEIETRLSKGCVVSKVIKTTE